MRSRPESVGVVESRQIMAEAAERGNLAGRRTAQALNAVEMRLYLPGETRECTWTPGKGFDDPRLQQAARSLQGRLRGPWFVGRDPLRDKRAAFYVALEVDPEARVTAGPPVFVDEAPVGLRYVVAETGRDLGMFDPRLWDESGAVAPDREALLSERRPPRTREWDESKHPRYPDGRFAPKGQGSILRRNPYARDWSLPVHPEALGPPPVAVPSPTPEELESARAAVRTHAAALSSYAPIPENSVRFVFDAGLSPQEARQLLSDDVLSALDEQRREVTKYLNDLLARGVSASDPGFTAAFDQALRLQRQVALGRVMRRLHGHDLLARTEENMRAVWERAREIRRAHADYVRAHLDEILSSVRTLGRAGEDLPDELVRPSVSDPALSARVLTEYGRGILERIAEGAADVQTVRKRIRETLLERHGRVPETEIVVTISDDPEIAPDIAVGPEEATEMLLDVLSLLPGPMKDAVEVHLERIEVYPVGRFSVENWVFQTADNHECMIHELMHVVETVDPYQEALSRAFLTSRTEPNEKLVSLPFGLVVKRDRFPDAYAARDYGYGTEVLSVGAEISTYGREEAGDYYKPVAGMLPEDEVMYRDQDHVAHVLGRLYHRW